MCSIIEPCASVLVREGIAAPYLCYEDDGFLCDLVAAISEAISFSADRRHFVGYGGIICFLAHTSSSLVGTRFVTLIEFDNVVHHIYMPMALLLLRTRRSQINVKCSRSEIRRILTLLAEVCCK